MGAGGSVLPGPQTSACSDFNFSLNWAGSRSTTTTKGVRAGLPGLRISLLATNERAIHAFGGELGEGRRGINYLRNIFAAQVRFTATLTKALPPRPGRKLTAIMKCYLLCR